MDVFADLPEKLGAYSGPIRGKDPRPEVVLFFCFVFCFLFCFFLLVNSGY